MAEICETMGQFDKALEGVLEVKGNVVKVVDERKLRTSLMPKDIPLYLPHWYGYPR